MSNIRIAAGAALLVTAALALTACGPGHTAPAASQRSRAASTGQGALTYKTGTAAANGAPKDTGDFASPGDTAAAAQWVQLSSAAAGTLNPVVVNGAGFTLYRFDKDSPDPSQSNCNGACAVTWPPVLVNPDGKIFLNGVPKSEIGVVRRADGKLQVTIGGWPVYRFSKDTAPGQTNGEGVDGTWYGVTPDGQKAGQSAPATTTGAGSALAYKTGTAAANGAPKDTGDFASPGDTAAAAQWVQLSSAAAGTLNPVVVNGAGFTLYRFDKDSPDPSQSNCNGACAVTWPPVLVNPDGKIFLNGVPKSEIGVVRRADGKLQVTIGGWPVYRFSKDTAPGQTNGEGVDGTWYAVSPEGGKVLPLAG